MSGRGRGKRGAAKTAAADAVADAVAETPVKEEKPKKTTKKKQFPCIATVGPDGIEGNLLPETKRPLIVHLPIQSKDVISTDMPLIYDPLPPSDALPYDSNADNPFYEGVEQVETTFQNEIVDNIAIAESKQEQRTEVATTITSQEPEVDYYNLKSTLLVQFKESTEVKAIPQTTDVACFWCCHTFTWRPVILPIRDTGKYLEVEGNYCSPECSAAHLFKKQLDSHTRWEQLALLYRLYGDACDGKIHPAPSPMVIAHFGGNLSISQYRSMMRSQKVRIDVHLPPMVSILATMDTKPIDFYDASPTKGVTETVKERIQKAEEVLRLRRTKPLKAWESTLDSFISLKARA
jgi:hypothetical protein